MHCTVTKFENFIWKNKNCFPMGPWSLFAILLAENGLLAKKRLEFLHFAALKLII